jgi:signal transduction histidine kinase
MNQNLRHETRRQQSSATEISQPEPLAAGTAIVDIQQLREQHMELLVEVMPAAIFMCDTDGLITYYNQRAAELWGRHPKLNDPEDRYCGSFRIYRLDGSLLPHHQCPMAVAVLAGQGTRHEEIHFLRPDGTTIIASVNIDPLYDQTGRRIGAINVFEDITARKQAEEALRQARDELEQRVAKRTEELERRNQELDQFAYVASHDLKSPLRAIDALATWIAEDSGNALPAVAQAHLEKLRGRVQRMERLLDDLLAYYRASREQSAPEEVDTAALVQGLVDLLSLPSGFQVTVADAMPVILTEAVPLELVMRNLLDNAIKHHHQPQTGHVYVSAEDHDPYVQFAIADNGPGIDPRFHERIFQVFQTLKPRDEVEGSGMGLAVVKKIVESRGGSVWVESEAGQGATFRFTWPKKDDKMTE